MAPSIYIPIFTWLVLDLARITPVVNSMAAMACDRNLKHRLTMADVSGLLV